MKPRSKHFGRAPRRCRICRTTYPLPREAEDCEVKGEPWDPFPRGTVKYDDDGSKYVIVGTAVHLVDKAHERLYEVRIDGGPRGNWFTVGQIQDLHY